VQVSGEDRALNGSVAGAKPTSVYAELRPPPQLASHACCVWMQAAGPSGHVQRVLPDGCTDIVWMAGGQLVVAGPATGHVLAEIPPGVTALGVRFGPGAAGAALGLPANELQDRTVEIADLWGAAGRELTERMALASPLRRLELLADVVARRLRDARPPDPVVPRAAVEVGYADQPHLTRESTALTGLPPVALLASRQPRGLTDGVTRA
jgi:hypothetical protein